jgi:hypothetical protein
MKSLSIFCLVLAACAATSRSASVSAVEDDRAAATRLMGELSSLANQLDQAQAVTVPRCDRICPVIHNIRHLSQMICELSTRHPDDATLAADCRDGKLRAERARTRVPSTCACE